MDDDTELLLGLGAVGIILRPRSTDSISLISTTDGGTHVDLTSGRRVGVGSSFSRQGVIDTFAHATTYNEWNVRDADTIGIFLHPTEPLDVAQKVSLADMPGYDASMGNEDVVGLVRVKREEVAAEFPGLPIYSLSGTDIVRLEDSGPVRVDASQLYGTKTK